MDTKWKGTKWDVMGSSCLKILRREEKWLLLGLLGCIGGFSLLQKLEHLQARSLPGMALQINLAFAIGGISLVKYGMKHRNKNWDLESGRFFQEWKHRQKNLSILLLIFWILFGILSCLFFNSIKMGTVSLGTVSMNYMHFKNYSIGYILVGTLAIQWVICRVTGSLELKKWLDYFMENEAQINQKNLEAALRSEKMKVDLISNVSHDLKTPLTSMVGYIELLKKEELGDAASDYVEVISNRAQKLKEMVESLFDLAKTSSGNVELKFVEIEMNCLIEQVMADMAEQISKSGRETVVSLAQEHTAFLSDSIYMYRIVQNLIENALKYSQENTRIFLKTSVAGWQKPGEPQANGGRKVRFEITNTASYRMDFTKGQIVERFARGEESRTTEGNGLGLAIVNTYTAALGGRFDVSIDCDQFKAIVEF